MTAPTRTGATTHQAAQPQQSSDIVGPRTERDLRRFEAYCRWSIHSLVLCAGFVLSFAGLARSGLLDGNPTETSLMFMAICTVVVLVYTGFGIAVTEYICREITMPRWVAWGFGLSAALVTFGPAAFLPAGEIFEYGAGPYWVFGPLGLACTALVCALTKQWRRVAAGAVVAALVLLLVYVGGPAHAPMQVAVAMVAMTFWFCVFVIPAAMSTRWMIDVVRRLWQSREVAADLAVAEERLRFSRDLHDVFGRTLSTGAVKSERAAELTRRGDDRAVDEMMAVRELAQTALSDVRGLVRGYRRIELGDEIAGARSVLRSAGIRLRMDDVDDLDHLTARLSQPAAEALAWVVREGTTNVLRHGQGGDVVLDLRTVDDRVKLTLTNGLPRGAAAGSGSGLIGLRERLEAVGGTLNAGSQGSGFALVASVPADATDVPR